MLGDEEKLILEGQNIGTLECWNVGILGSEQVIYCFN